jgi:type I restriction-modification system DNA methylase subunit
MTAPTTVHELVERFHQDIDAYKSGLYNETQTRQEFIDPLFEALGWDIGNRRGAAAAFREVLLEYSMKIGGATKAPDYLFRLGNENKFFVEAKKPAVNLKEDISPAFQLRRYAWSATLPLSVLTDFEEFAVYDCRIVPDKNDKASVARTLYIPYTDYADQWDAIYSLFSREAVLDGALDKYAETLKAQKGVATVDAAFLKEIERWRELLAHNIAVWNSQLTQRELNYAVQMTIDRIIFLRICEDRGIELYGRLMALQNGNQVYERLCHLFRQADDRYNSGLFHFQNEKGRLESPDDLTLSLYIEDEPLKKIIKSLYYPDSPYEFSVLPVEILGQVYEQFLGKVIHLGKDRRVAVEEKPEVRKAGGVYYTPSYIVEYIVKNTVGKLLEGKTPKEGAKLRILDPACGSGSFLLGAYQYLLDWHRDKYVADGPQKHKKELYQGPGGDWRLTPAERKRILLNNIYGVDIDSQAVEVTKLSLSLKVLEGENEATLGTQLRMFHERALPDLGDNIKCGNSLIGPDFYDQQRAELLDEAAQYRINVFDWKGKDGFLEIMKAGGFDAVIGNPPWTFTKYVDWGEETKNYIHNHYLFDRELSGKSKARQSGKINMFAMFILKGIRLLKQGGQFGFIVPNNILRTTVYDTVRKDILETTIIRQVVDLKPGVFLGVTASTIIFLVEAGKPTANSRIEIVDNNLANGIREEIDGYIPQHECLENPSYVINIFLDAGSKTIHDKMDRQSIKLGEIVNVYNGIATNKDMEGVSTNKIDDNYIQDLSRPTPHPHHKLLRPRRQGPPRSDGCPC